MSGIARMNTRYAQDCEDGEKYVRNGEYGSRYFRDVRIEMKYVRNGEYGCEIYPRLWKYERDMSGAVRMGTRCKNVNETYICYERNISGQRQLE